MYRAALSVVALCAVLMRPAIVVDTSGGPRATYILPAGRGYGDHDGSTHGIAALRPDGPFLGFGDEVEIVDEAQHAGRTWFRCTRHGTAFYLPASDVTEVRRGAASGQEGNLPIGEERVDLTHPLSIDYAPSDLEIIPSRYAAEGYADRVLLLRAEAKTFFVALIDDAAREGVVIRMLSAYRTPRYQSDLYAEALVNGGTAQNRVAKPGHSEHQLGTSCDLTTDEIGYELSTRFERTRAFRWMTRNAHRYGIVLSYPSDHESITGYAYEPWHFRYHGVRP